MTVLPRGTVTFLFSDIEGSTRRWAENPDMEAALADHDRVVRASIESAGGHWVKHTGDGVLAVFDDAAAAVQTAARIQESMARGELQVRIGLHTGTAHQRGSDYFGLTVSTTARIMDAGHGGQVLVSEATKSAAAPALERFNFDNMGVHHLKDLGDPQRLYQLSGEGLQRDFPPLRTLDTRDHNLPVQLTSFIGRESELAQVTDLISQQRLTTLTGVGGAGKTRLSLQAAAEVLEDFEDGVWLVELAPVTDPDLVPSAVATALGVRHEKGSPQDLIERIIDHTRGKQLLLIVDNCEHVLTGVADLIQRILSASPEVTVLASSREGLGIPGERIVQVPSLGLQSNEGDSEASRLFTERAKSVAPQLELTAETQPHVDRICQLLDGIPLAIELAAARTRVLSVDQISQRLDNRFRLLTGGSRSAMPRQQTLEAAVDWSYRLLSEPERNLFERLSVFVGGFDLQAAEEVAAGRGLDQFDVLDLLTGLVDKSMVVAEHDATGVSRYHLLETLRQFGLRRLVDSDEIEHWKTSHLQYFVGQVHERGVLSWWYGSYVPWFRIEQGNLTVALEWARESAPDAITPLATALSELYFYELGDPVEALARCEEALTAAGSDDATVRLRTHKLRLLPSLNRINEVIRGWELLQPELEDASPADFAWCLMRMSALHAFDPELDATQSTEMARRAMEISRDLDIEARFSTEFSLGMALIWTNAEVDEVETVLRSAAEKARSLGDPDRRMLALSWLGVASATKDQREGTSLSDSVEDQIVEVWESAGRPTSEESIPWIAMRRGWWELADDQLDRMAPTLRGVHRIQMLMPRACLRWMQGRYDEADSDFDEVAGYGIIRRWHHDYYPTRAEVAAFRGDPETTSSWVDRHFEMQMGEAEEVTRIATLRPLVMSYVADGDLERAQETLAHMREIASRHSQPSIPSVQIGSERLYLSLSEAELTRLTGPDPSAWERCEALSTWVFWALYCRVRHLEAKAALGVDIAHQAGELRSELETMGAGGLIEILETVDR